MNPTDYYNLAAAGVRAEIRERRFEAQTAVDDAVRALNNLRHIKGCRPAFIIDTLRGLREEADRISHHMTEEMNDAGVDERQDLDLEELDVIKIYLEIVARREK